MRKSYLQILIKLKKKIMKKKKKRPKFKYSCVIDAIKKMEAYTIKLHRPYRSQFRHHYLMFVFFGIISGQVVENAFRINLNNSTFVFIVCHRPNENG